MQIPSFTEELLEDLVESIQISPSRYEAADRSYKSVGDWLHRSASTVRDADPQVYIQGSFRLGTVIKPISDQEDYDVDLVCQVSIAKSTTTQQKLKEALGVELALYAKAHGMSAPTEGRRCWTQNYADGAQFHLDTLPAIPDAARHRLLLETAGYNADWTATSIAITDREHVEYDKISNNWPLSNPRGYGNWFRSRMGPAFEARRKAIALQEKASVEKIPEYRVRTPLQSAVQLLKHHRNIMFQRSRNPPPISIILTTLAGLSYEQEPRIGTALLAILDRMDTFIEKRGGLYWIPNPTNAFENFADRWAGSPERSDAFFRWLERARSDFGQAANATNYEAATAMLFENMGEKAIGVAKAARGARAPARVLSTVAHTLNPNHKKNPPWDFQQGGTVKIERAVLGRNGYRPKDVQSGAEVLLPGCSIRFEADTNIPRPFKVYWQVVNTGDEALAANNLRGGFDEGEISVGKLTRDENTKYRGVHSIECFVVKNGFLVARSGQFIVRIGA